MKRQSLAAARCVVVLAMFMASAGRAGLTDGLVADYSFSGNADDTSGNGHDGVAYGPVLTTDRFGVGDSAYSFDGVDDYIAVPYAGEFDLQAFTIAAWICPSDDLSLGSDSAVIAARGEDFANDRLWSSLEIVSEGNPWGTGATLLYEDSGDTEQVFDTGSFPEPGIWSHVAATRSLDDEVSLYFDGALVGNWLGTPDPATCAQDLTIGARWSSPTRSGPYILGGFFSGSLDDICLYDRALTAGEIESMSQRTLTISSTEGGSVTDPGEGTFNYTAGVSVSVVAVAETHYHFANWTGTAVDAGQVADPTSASITIMMDADYTLQADFAINTYTLTVNAVDGSVTCDPDKPEYPHGETVTLQAIPNPGYRFTDWTGDLSGSDNPITITMDADKTVTANFIIQRTLVISSTAGGAVTSPGEGSFVYDDGTEVVLDAEADPLFEFVGWRGSHFASWTPYSVTTDADYDIKACFESVLNVLYVDDDACCDPGPGDLNVSDPQEDGTPEHPFDSIQEAIDVARVGARIIVRPGTYLETIDLLGKSIEVNGLNADDPNIMPLPVIDGGDEDTVVRCTQGEDPNCVLCGFVITGGKGWLGGGILCMGSSPTVLNCLIVGNRAMGLDAGGGIHCQDSSAVFVNCTISGNCGGSAGAGLCLSNSNVTVLDSIVWENMPTQIRLIGSGDSVVAYTAVTGGWPGDGIVDADPHFVQPGYWADPADITEVLPATDPLAVWVSGDYHLMSQAGCWDPTSKTWITDPVTSPCIDAGDPSAPTGQEPSPNGARINLGVYGGTSQASMSTGDG